MRKWKKRLLGVLLCVVLVTAMVVPAMAFGDTDVPSEDENMTPTDVVGNETADQGDEEEPDAEDPDTEDPDAEEPDPEEPDEKEHGDGIYQNPDDGDWYYYKDGQIDTSLTDVVKDTIGTIGEQGDWWNVVDGKVTPGETVAQNSKGWWYIDAKGMVDFSYTGFAKNDRGSWYCEKGKVTFTTNSVLKDADGKIGEAGTWWYVVGSKVQADFTGLANYKNASGWWYIEDGKVTFTANTVAKNQNGWFCVRNSKVDLSYTGFGENENGKWYVRNGSVQFSENGVLQDTTGAIGEAGTWWYVLGSKVQESFTGLANYKNENGWWYIEDGKVTFTANTVAKNKNGWFCVRNSKVDFSYSGFGENDNGQWYCEGGKVTLSKNGVLKDATGAIGTQGTWYYVLGSKVQTSFTGLANYSNASGWWYITNGQVDFSHNGVDQNKNGWWYVTGGKVQMGFTGLANYSNANGWWYIKNGKVDFTHSGVEKNKKGWWYVSGGKVNFSFSGIASNSNGMWLIKNGKVNFDYSGEYTYSGVTYTVKNGKASISLNGMSSSMYNKAQSQSSSTNWLIMVDVDNCKLGILQGYKGNWVPVKYWTCSTGAPDSPTVRGTYSLTSKGKSFGDGFTCWYYNQFYGNYLIHSILYNPGSMTSVQDGRLGEHVSHGCVRLALANAKYIYDNVPIGTTVVTY